LNKDPLALLPEIQDQFGLEFGFTVSCATISRELAKAKITYKVIEKRATQIKEEDVARFQAEMMHLKPHLEQLLFVDETSFDRRSMQRRRGWGPEGEKVVVEGDFLRSKRLSFVAFLGVEGVVDVDLTPGTFTRHRFLQSAEQLLNSGKVHKYPGKHSIWIMDGASIHLSADLMGYLWCMGIKVFFPSCLRTHV